jgi:sialate O-acetylesterase
MEVSLDLFSDPKNSASDTQTLADRLVKAASFLTTGEKIEYMGPVYKSLKVENGAIRLKFDHAETGLVLSEGDLLRTFQIAGPDRVWHWADARIEGKDVIVSLHEVPTPVAVRYAWADNWLQSPPPANLANRAGFPAGTFRTDTWPIVTDGLVAGGNGYPTEKARTYWH